MAGQSGVPALCSQAETATDTLNAQTGTRAPLPDESLLNAISSDTSTATVCQLCLRCLLIALPVPPNRNERTGLDVPLDM